jgi:iron complex outermembrane receptor protein
MKQLRVLAVGLIVLSPSPGLAQSAAGGEGDTGALAEVIVTAQRRAENLQDVPISITAFTGDELWRTNVRGAPDYLLQTPNVSFTEDKQSGARGLAVAIRGVNDLVTGENAFVNSIGIYLDEFSIASVPNGLANPFIPDMERIEVLRGPQGTYFGRNALGGALNLTTQTPTDKFEGRLEAGAEGYNTYGHTQNYSAIVNVPVTESFKTRLVATYTDSTGFVQNIGPGNGAFYKWLNLRFRGIWTPTPTTTVNLSYLYGKEHQGADNTVPSGVNDLDTIDTFGYQPGKAFDPGTGFFPANQSKYSADLNQRNDDKSQIGVINVAQQLGGGVLWKTIAGIIKSDQERFFDNDLVGNLDLLARTNNYTGKSWSIESRLESRNETVTWVVGGMYAKDEQDQLNDVAVSSDPTATLTRDGTVYGFLPPFPPGLGLALNSKEFKVSSAAGFADVTWHISHALDVFAGARYTHDSVEKDELQYGIRPGANPDPTCSPPPASPADPRFFPCFGNFPRPAADGSASFSNVTPRFGGVWKFADSANLYLTISQGYKAGGLSTGNNTNLPGSPPIVLPYNKETMWSYELGVKSELADHRVRLNAAIFYMRWKDAQFEAFRFLTPGDLSSNFEQTINIPTSESKGAELEIVARATQNLTLGANLGYLDAKILDNQACSNAADPLCVNGHQFTQITGGYLVNLQGLPVPNSPKWTAYAYGEYRLPVGSNSAWARVEYQHRSSIYTDIEAAANQQTLGPSPNQGLTRYVPPNQFPYLVPSYNVVNLRGGFDWQRWFLTLYIQNLTDEKYYTGTYQKFGLSGIRLRPNPMTFGGSIAFRF